MKTVTDISSKLNPAGLAWLKIWRQKYNLTAESISRKLREKIGEDVDPASIEEYLQSRGLSSASDSDVPETNATENRLSSQFSAAMERDIELALLSQLDSLGLQLFIDEDGRDGNQYVAGDFGRIDILATDANGDFVVIELKRDDVPRATIGQLAGYLAFVKENIANPRGRSVTGWIVARRSSLAQDRVFEEAANAVGILVKWYSVRLDFRDESMF
ncbi:MAG: DUF1016 family protein [Acidobacteriaceae bacterium]|nr:DUF1016 family protein [Acidobacteriaceae bacterium]